MAKQVENLSPVETKALATLISETVAKKASAEISVGDHAVDFTLHVSGKLTRGEDYESHKVAKADPWLLLLVALSHLNGVTVESITREALAADVALVDNLKKEAKVAIEAIKAPTLGMENGKVTVDLIAARV